ncbi:hypothetical protein VHEMI01191 [[Torrubiella] hemipterigena]|uniref:tripeptidyl-peptidase II n=1 Tax=[Torrubiella] hemipterigena TaxID=1531966 RepID=A0A0A1T6R7_9HYPO|nr:hypothetical protein VHEMI01191 [[Torrubiella] hemipterigena]
MSLSSLLLPVLVATLAAGSPLGQFVTKDALADVPSGWQAEAAAPADHQLSIHIRLREQNMDKLAERTLQASDPTHANYGQHLSKAEVDALTAPSKETIDAVTQWLKSQGVEVGEVNSGYINPTISVSQAKKLFDADYKVYKHAETGRSTVRTTKYSVPRAVADSIAMIQPTTLFSDLGLGQQPVGQAIISNPHENVANAAAASADGSNDDPKTICNAQNSTLTCLRANYNIKGWTPKPGTTEMGVCGFLEEVPSMPDLSKYLQRFTTIPPSTTMKIVSVNGGGLEASGQGEANLDSQITVPVTYPMNNVFYSVGGRPPWIPIDGATNNTNEPYLDWLKYTIAMDKPAQTYSISYGDDERSVPADYMDAVCSQFMKLGARGVSVLVSSGDNGVGDTSACKKGTTEYDQFRPSFPATCPWVTVVGGTNHYADDEEADVESGGGFSNHFDQPQYQRDVVHTYVRRIQGEFKGHFNTSGRAYPDVSASYRYYPAYFHGQAYLFRGTSASAPLVASVISLLNDELVAKGKPPLGFLNPWLYKRGNRGFRDIAKGHSNGCNTVPGFRAIQGWDPVTGYGVPNYEKLRGLIYL